MAFSFINQTSATGTGVTSLTVNVPAAVAVGDLLVMGLAFESVASNSGPWVIPNVGQFSAGDTGPAAGWQQACFQQPSATGSGLEVWCAIYTSGVHTAAHFVASENVVGVMAAYRGEYNPTGNILGAPPRLAPTAQPVGNAPAAPSVSVNNGELVVALGADAMTGSLFGTPSGFTNRVDVARSGAGTVEGTIADATSSVVGATGPITFPNAAASSTTAGATATLVIAPTPTTAGVGGIINAGLPEDLDIGPRYTLRVTALDPTTGNPVSGVTMSNLIFTADQVEGTPGELEVGPFMLVPGPNA